MPDQLWAPWRFKYIKDADTTNAERGCVFCSILASPDERESLLLHRGTEAFVLLNAYPYTSGHLMVAPVRHVADLTELSDSELLEIQQLTVKAIRWLKEVYRPHGFNVGYNLGSAAGAGIPGHIHCHVVPRWNGDTNFMTPVGDVRVIPEDLLSTYDKLKAVTNGHP